MFLASLSAVAEWDLPISMSLGACSSWPWGPHVTQNDWKRADITF
jgi:hypothetical protein